MVTTATDKTETPITGSRSFGGTISGLGQGEVDDEAGDGAESSDDDDDQGDDEQADHEHRAEDHQPDGENPYQAEEAPVRTARNPAEPTPEERRRHWITHLPPRAWCPICQKARGKEDPHKRKKRDEDSLPEVAMDYAEIGDEECERDQARKLLIGRAKPSGSIFAHLVSQKGLGDDKIVGKICNSLKEFGITSVGLKTDGEPALVQVQEAVISQRQHSTLPINPPAHDPQSNGVAERTVQEVKNQLRVIKLALEYRLKKELTNDLCILEWMIPQASNSLNRFQVSGDDGRTPYYRVHLRNFNGKCFEFGEQVLAKPKRKKSVFRSRTLDARMMEATWVGYSTRSNEHIVVMSGGGPAIRVRTVKPRPESEQWSYDAIIAIAATPDKPNPRDSSQTAPRPERDTQGIDFGRGASGGHALREREPGHQLREPGLVREFRITDQILDKYGMSPSCPGCDAKLHGRPARRHTIECRRRLEEAMNADEQDIERLRKRDERIAEKIVEKSIPADEAERRTNDGRTTDERTQNQEIASPQNHPPFRGLAKTHVSDHKS